MASDYSYVKLCMTDLMINNSGGAEVALSCRPLFQHLVLTFSNRRLYKFNTSLIVCLWMDREQPSGFSACQAKLAECPNSMLPHTALFIAHK